MEGRCLKQQNYAYNLNMIRDKEIPEIPHSFHSHCRDHLSTAQEKNDRLPLGPGGSFSSRIIGEEWEGQHFTPSNSFSLLFEESGGESITSLERDLTFEHLACLQANISEIGKNIFQIPKNLDLTKLWEMDYQEDESTFLSFIRGGGSPIPSSQLPVFMEIMREHSSLRRVVTWMYGHVQSQLSDELILAAFRIALAYRPVKYLVQGVQGWAKLAELEFNLINVYCDPALRMLNYFQLYKLGEEGVYFDEQLHRFLRFYLVTVLLVLQEYYENPGYTKAISQKLKRNGRKRREGHAKTAKKKIIRKGGKVGA